MFAAALCRKLNVFVFWIFWSVQLVKEQAESFSFWHLFLKTISKKIKAVDQGMYVP
jgi:hypothetical protein